MPWCPARYFCEVMCILNVIRQSVFGEPMHIYTGHRKETLRYSFNADGTLTFAGEGARNRMGNFKRVLGKTGEKLTIIGMGGARFHLAPFEEG